MKKVLNSLIAVAVLATAAFAANTENPLYAPAQMGFYSKTGAAWMYKKSDDNPAMKAKDWANETENPIPRFTEDFGFGITDWLTFRGAFGYTNDGDIKRSGMHQARLGLNFRAVNSPKEAVVWDIYADAFLGGVSKMKAELVGSKNNLNGTYPLSFNYENYGNGRWGVWVGTQLGKQTDKFAIATFGEIERTFGNNNNEIKISKTATPIIQKMVATGAIYTTCATYQIPAASCNKESLGNQYDAIASGANAVAKFYVDSLPKKFSVDTKSTWEFAVGLKTLYEINNDWSFGGALNIKHRATNSIEAVNIVNTSEVPDKLTVAKITQNIADSFVGSMEDGVDEIALSLLGSRQLTDHLQFTLYGEYTYDIAEEKAQLGTNMKAELGLRMNLQF